MSEIQNLAIQNLEKIIPKIQNPAKPKSRKIREKSKSRKIKISKLEMTEK